MIAEHIRPTSRSGRKAKVHVVRYADDFVITGSSRELLRDEIQPLVEQFLRERGLELSVEKTRITHITEGFDFLGQHLRKFAGGMLVQPAKDNVQAFLAKVRHIVKSPEHNQAGELIQRLNPVIQGWAMYHRHVASKRTFTQVDSAIFTLLWHWVKRQHPHKSQQWWKAKYFHTQGTRRWVFTGHVHDADGTQQTVHLYRAAQTPIRRHVVIKGEANPYDPTWELYFDQRLGKQWVQGRQRRKLLTLWRLQQGRCSQCRQRITKETGWHIHHRQYRVYGGTDAVENLALLHPNCHCQVHCQHSREVKPDTTCLEEA